MRIIFAIGSIIILALTLTFAYYYPETRFLLFIVVPLCVIGWVDFFQKKHTIRRNFPLIGWFRYMFEAIRPEINQYFVESNSDGRPFSREQRSIVYQRAKKALSTLPFGTQLNVYDIGYEWVNHSISPVEVAPSRLRINVGSSQCSQPYNASILNISAMSYGALSKRAILSLNYGAHRRNFAHNTGEGGISPYHRQGGGDLIWQIGTGYFGCRTPEGRFDETKFAEQAGHNQVKMIEVKLSQGAKPGHGGILPGIKVNEEIAAIRGVEVGKDVISPPGHKEFTTPIELLQFVQRLRQASNGKPIGLKLCVGKRREFFAICKAMHKTGILVDYIAVDGGEGGTGAAPLEFSNHLGTPATEGLIFVHNALVGMGLRDEIKVFASGKVITAFDMIKYLAIGADIIYSARAFMLALGCIQALRCNHNVCPAGIATNKPHLVAGIDVTDKSQRVANFHEETLKSCAELLGAMGLKRTSDLRPWHIMRRIDNDDIRHYGEIYEWLEPNSLLCDDLPKSYARAFRAAAAESFAAAVS